MWAKVAQFALKKLLKGKNGKTSGAKLILCILAVWMGVTGVLVGVAVGINAINGVALSGKVPLEEMEEEEKAELEKTSGKWLESYGNYLDDPPTSSYNQDVYSSLQNLKVENVKVPFQEYYLYQLQSVGNPIMFFESQHVHLSYGLIKSLEVMANIKPTKSIPKLQPKNVSFQTVNMTVTAKVVTRYEPQEPYYRAVDEHGNPRFTAVTVQNGDTLESLANRFHMNKDDVIQLNGLRYTVPIKDSDGNPMLDTEGKPMVEEKIKWNVGMNIQLVGEYYQPPDKAIYAEQTFTYPVTVPKHIDTYNGKYDFNFDTNTITEDIKTANNPENQGRRVDADGQKESLTIQMPIYSSSDYEEDYSVIDDMLKKKGFYDEEDQLVIWRQAMAYDPMFSDKKANSAFAQSILAELSKLGMDDLFLTSIGSLSGVYCGQVPQEYYSIYEEAGQAYNVPWVVLASIHKIETNFGTSNPMVSYRGAVGHTQFMPSTWLGWNYPNHDKYGNIPNGAIDITNLQNIAQYGGYGTDGDGDGIADPFNPVDAIHTTAKYISANGGSSGDLYNAIYAYNHSDQYVNSVLNYIQLISNGGTSCTGGGGGTAPVQVDNEVINNALNFGYGLIGRSTYVLGAGRTPETRSLNQYDCSAFVWYAYMVAGVDINGNCSVNGHCAVNTLSLITKGVSVPYSEIQVGDLVFFNTTGRHDSHVGIYVGNGQFIGSQSSTGVAVAKLEGNSYWWNAFTSNGSHVRRVVSSN